MSGHRPGARFVTGPDATSTRDLIITHGACRNTRDPELWFPIGDTGSSTARQIALAKSACARCTVRTDCLEYALATRADHGIWGGLTEKERVTLRRKHLREASR